MKTLLLMRHAKSSWDEAVDDHERPLNERGNKAAPRMGKLLSEQKLNPDLILSSTARRARATARAVAKASGFSGRVETRRELYLAEPHAYLVALRGAPEDAGTLLVVGHNPGLEQLLSALTGRQEPMPTACLARISLPIERWSGLILDGGAELVALWRPKELD